MRLTLEDISWRFKQATYLVGGILALVLLGYAVLWTMVVFLAIWTGDGIPTAWASICGSLDEMLGLSCTW